MPACGPWLTHLNMALKKLGGGLGFGGVPGPVLGSELLLEAGAGLMRGGHGGRVAGCGAR